MIQGATTSFYLTYVLLLTTGTITFIESLRTPIAAVRHIMNLETCISVIAAFFYGRFVKMIEDSPATVPPDYAAINRMRYTDWFITTPLMLLVICLVFAYNNGTSVRAGTYGIVLALNVVMLLSGYFGDRRGAVAEPRGPLTRKQGLAVGFAAYFALFGVIWYSLVRGSRGADNYAIFALFSGLWALYGVVYMLDEERKNLLYNVLDAMAKCFVGIFLWAYFTRVLVI